jgi:hypothetical protein
MGVAARIAAEPRREKSHAGAGFLHSVRAWFANALVAPRFSPAMTAAMMLLAIGATATVMRYMNSQPTPPVAPRDLASGVQPSVTATPPSIVVQQPTPEATPSIAPAVVENGDPVDVNEQATGREKNLKAELPRKRETERKPAAAANDPAQMLAASQNSEIVRRQRATERLVREAESKYLAAIQMLSEDVNRKRTRLDPQVAARFDETLATIDRSIAETRRTVLQQRNDPVAVQYMLSAYAKKVEVMREMAAVD